ncbi:[4Fe-4S] proteins maturation [Geranomyces michiganensis]|nr:[4Fe-4S] proteins maturation [Geranomyces michiganensis]
MNRLARPLHSSIRFFLRRAPTSSPAVGARAGGGGQFWRQAAAAPPSQLCPRTQLRFLSAQANPSPAITTATSIPEAPPSANPVLVVSQNAANRINEINKRTKSEKMLRVTVESGGCHGFQYKMELTAETDPEDDTVFDLDGARVVVDSVSLDFVGGSTLDYIEELIGSSFQVTNNPKAESSCGCKTSFNIKF